MTSELLLIRELPEDDEDSDDQMFPGLSPDGQWHLNQDETVIWEGPGHLSQHRLSPKGWVETWQLPGPAEITATTERLLYLCQKFEKGRNWIGGGMLGTALSAGSHLRSAARRHGKVAIGQVRYQWPAGVVLETNVAAIGATDTYVGLHCQDSTGNVRVRVRLPKREAPDVAELLVRQIADFRLQHPYIRSPMPPQAAADLRAQSEEPTAEGKSSRGIAKQQLLIYSLSHPLRLPAID